MRKKIYIIQTLIVFIVSLFFVGIAHADNPVNLLVNGGFETVEPEGNIPTGWWEFWGKTQWTNANATIHLVTGVENVYSDSYAVKLDSPTTTYITQRVQGLVPHAKYVISAKIKTTGTVYFKLEYFNQDGVQEWFSYQDGTNNTSGSWVDCTTTAITMYDKVDDIRLYAMSSGGVSYIDDISLYKVSDPDRFTLSLDKAIYYTEQTADGKAKLILDDFYNDYDLNTQIVFKLKDDSSTVLLSKTVNGISDLEFTYPMSLLQEGQVYTVSATMYDGLQNELQSQYLHISKYDKPSKVGNNNFIINGEVIKPIIGMAARPTSMYYKFKEAGINTVYCAAQDLDACAAEGLKGVVMLYSNMKPAGHPDNITNTTSTVTTYKNHPALLAWAVMDEPFGSGGDYNNKQLIMFDSYKIIRDIDPNTPISICETPFEYAINYSAKYCDILLSDPYPGSAHDPASFIADTIKIATKAVNYEKPVLAVLQTFLWSGYFPTTQDCRNGMYQAFLEGACGIAYYSIENSYGTTPLYNTSLWQGLVDFYNNESALTFEHFIDKTTSPFNDYRGVNDAWYHGYVKDGKIYLIVLNRSATSKNISIPIISYDRKISVNGFYKEVIIGSSETSETITGNILNVSLTPNCAILYRITPAGTFDFSGLSWEEFENGSYNLVPAGDFEVFWDMGAGEISEYIPEGWSILGNGSIVPSWDDLIVRDGANTYLEIDGYAETTGEKVKLTINNAVVGTTYEFSYDVCSNSNSCSLVYNAGTNVSVYPGNTGGSFVAQTKRFMCTRTDGKIELTFANSTSGMNTKWDNIKIRALNVSNLLVFDADFNEDSGVNVLNSVNGTSGSVNGATWVPGVSGSALSFDGNNDYVSFGAVLDLDGSRTISAWIKPDVNGTMNVIASTFTWECSLFVNNGKLRAYINGTISPASSISSDVIITTGEWQHVAMTFDVDGDKKIRLYRDGVEVSCSTQTALAGSPVDISSYMFSIGSNIGTYHFFDGCIDEVRVYKRALNANEITHESNLLVFDTNFDEDAEYNIYNSVNGASGSVNGATWVPGVSGNALSFDGINDYVSFGAALDLDGSRTIAAWIKPDVNGTMNVIASTFTWECSLFVNDGKLRAYINGTTSPASSISSDVIITTGEWQHVAMTFDGDGDKKIRLYRNGVEVSYSTQTALVGSPVDISSYMFSIGSNIGTYHFFDGYIDEVKVFAKELSESEIFYLALEHLNVLYVDMDEGIGTTVNDTNNGTLGSVNGATWVSGVSGSALSFDGNNDYVSFGAVLDLDGSRTISAWIKPDVNGTMNVIASTFTWECSLFVNDGKLRAYINGTNSPASSISSDVIITTGEWQHVAMTFDVDGDKKIHLYRNGVEVSCSTQTTLAGSPVDISSYMFSIGSNIGTYHFFDGCIDEVRVFDIALTGNNINDIYRSNN